MLRVGQKLMAIPHAAHVLDQDVQAIVLGGKDALDVLADVLLVLRGDKLALDEHLGAVAAVDDADALLVHAVALDGGGVQDEAVGLAQVLHGLGILGAHRLGERVEHVEKAHVSVAGMESMATACLVRGSACQASGNSSCTTRCSAKYFSVGLPSSFRGAS